MAEPLNATFFAFRKREQGGVLVGAAIGYALGMIVLFALVAAAVWALLGPSFFTWYSNMIGAAAKGGVPDGSMPANFGRIFYIFPIELLFLVAVFVLLASFESASLRWLIRGERSGGPMGLHFGADMWRVYGTYWAWLVFSVLAMLGMFVVTMAASAVGLSSVGGKGDAGLGAGLAVVAICLVYFIAWLCAAVRLAPASATSVGTGQFAPFKAWSATRGRFWGLVGAFVLLWLIYFVVAMGFSLFAFAALFGSLFASLDWSNVASDPGEFQRQYLAAVTSIFTSPVSIALYVLVQIVGWTFALTFGVACYGVNARAVQAALEEGKIAPAAAA